LNESSKPFALKGISPEKNPKPMKPQSYLIIGCGRFGSRAARELLRRAPYSIITVVDKKRDAFKTTSRLPLETNVSDGLAYLEKFLSEGSSFDYVVPAVPFHLAFEFALDHLKPLGAKRKKIPPLPGLPNPIKGKNGDLYTSIADFICPEDCPEPARCCTVTKKRRPRPLYQTLMDLSGPFESKVIRSEQLGLGVGGFRTDALLRLLKNIKEVKEPDRLFLISTACRCHAVTSALSF
jgi:hypothetical protein